MTLFQQTVFKATKILVILKIGIQASFALQIEAPKEIEEHLLAYSEEIGMQDKNLVLRVENYTLKLIDNGKTVKEVKICAENLPNIALQNAVFEVFGQQKSNGLSGNFRTVLIGLGFAATGTLLYYSKPPKPVYGYKSNLEEK